MGARPVPVSPAFHVPGFCFDSFPKFDEILLGHALPWFTSAKRVHDAARAIFPRYVALNVRYVETSFHLAVTQFINTTGRGSLCLRNPQSLGLVLFFQPHHRREASAARKSGLCGISPPLPRLK